jgi:2-polyprenyl-3-methyl-5-hydroxy-6-metoxy-1,4-benzoquinol methylase
MHVKFEPRTCPICGQSNAVLVYDQKLDPAQLDEFAFASRKYPEYMHLRLVKCNTCALLYADPAPDTASLHHEYEKAAFDSSAEARCAAKTYLHYLPAAIKPGSALDIGCGGGEFLEMLLTRGVEKIQGVEPSSEAAKTACDKVRDHIRVSMFNADDFAPESFDLVSSFQTLEHVSDPLKLVQGAHTLLKKGGAFYSVSHNCEGALNKALGTKSPIYDIEHLQLFSPGSLKKLLEAAGFSHVRIFPIWNSYPLVYWIRLAPLPLGLKKRLIQGLHYARLESLSFAAPVGNMGVLGIKAP